MPLSTLALFFTVSAFAAAPFTLEQVLGTAFPSELTASPSGSKLAWASDQRGVRNLWVAEAPEYRGKQLTQFAKDDGLEITGVQWTPDATAILFVRGEGVNRAGEFPNPRSLTAGVKQTIWIAPLTGAPRQLAEGSAPAVSPDGKTVAYILRNEVWSVGTAPSAVAAVFIHARGTAQLLQWAPDGGKLAFISNRRNHSFLSLYNLADQSLTFPDASVDQDTHPVWSPDSRSVAYLRIPVFTREFAFGPVRTAEPWSIRICDAQTGKTRELWHAQEGAGSAFHEMVAKTQLLWGASNRIMFPWERDGYLHLYSLNAQGGVAQPLTPGAFEVEHVTLTPDGTHAVYSSNQGDTDRRHLWRVPLAGGVPVSITQGSEIEWSPAITNDGAATAFFHSSASQPARPAVQIGGRIHDLQPVPAEFSAVASALIAPEPVIVTATDGMPIHAQLFLPPKGSPNTKHPAVIFFHGGSRRQMLLGWHYMFYYHQAYAFNQYLASKGYVVLSVNYRSGIGYGLDFREAKEYGATGASEYNDVAGAGLYMRARADVDQQRIGLWGGSYGGYLTALGLARASDIFAAGVDLHGVHDWNSEIQVFAAGYDPEKQRDAARIAFASSPMNFVDTWKSPVLLIHGDDDRNVNFGQTVMLVEALRKRKVEFKQLIFPDEIHDFLLHSNWLRAYHAADDFFTAKLTSPAAAHKIP